MAGLRALLEPRVRRWWEAEPGLAMAGLAPAEALFRSAVRARGRAYDEGRRTAHVARIPVASVGNLTVGGTGKTPVAGWLVGRLLDLDLSPAVLLRGPRGDEAALHRRWHPGIRVVVEKDRVLGAARAAGLGARVAVLDDGFQHRRLARQLDLVLVAAEQPFPGRSLPRGPYREQPDALRRAHLVVVTRRTADDEGVERTVERIAAVAPDRPLAVVRLEPAGWTDLAGRPAAAPTGPVLAVASVARPGPFARLVEAAVEGPVELWAFPDHHDFRAADVRRIVAAARGRAVATTEKDAVKLERFADRLPDARALRLQVAVERGAARLDAALEALAAAARGDRPAGPNEPPGRPAGGSRP